MKVGHFRDYNASLHPNDLAGWFRGDFFSHREKTKRHLLTVFKEVFPGWALHRGAFYHGMNLARKRCNEI